VRYNKVILSGNLTKDPEVRYTASGTAVCNASMATDYGFGDNKGTAYVDLTIWGKRGEAFGTHLYKGDPAFVEGELRQESWEDRNTGAKRTKLSVTVQDWRFMESRKKSPPEEVEMLEEEESPF
jgi:single-strand DNA-binding protein